MLSARRAELGELLRTARDDAGLTLRQLASVSGVGKSQINRLEQGATEEPKVSDLAALAGVLQLSLAGLLDTAGIPLHRYLPDLSSYLRERYPELPAEAISEIQRHFDTTTRPYFQCGPRAGEDEKPETAPPPGNRAYAALTKGG